MFSPNEIVDSLDPVFEVKLGWSEETESVVVAIRMSREAGAALYSKGMNETNSQVTAKIMQIMAMCIQTEKANELQQMVTKYVLSNMQPEEFFGEESDDASIH